MDSTEVDLARSRVLALDASKRGAVIDNKVVGGRLGDRHRDVESHRGERMDRFRRSDVALPLSGPHGSIMPVGATGAVDRYRRTFWRRAWIQSSAAFQLASASRRRAGPCSLAAG